MDDLIFCDIDEHGFPHWGWFDFFRWYALPTSERFMTGKAYLWYYKTAWLVHHRLKIKKYAYEARIPEFLLAGVAVTEVGGTPEKFKGLGVLQFRQVIEEIISNDQTWSSSTSVGSVAIQIGVAANTIGIRPDTLTPFQQFRLSQCLLDNDFNIRVAAFHLHDLILFDYPDVNTLYLTDEQIIVAASRYNRGIARDKSDIINSIYQAPGTAGREYSEYGRQIIKKKEMLLKILKAGE